MRIEKIFKKEIKGEMTKHLEAERRIRLAVVNSLIDEENGVLIASFLVDKGHKNGAEIHNIYSNAVVKIYNANTHKFVTTFPCSPSQITLYWEECGIANFMPKGLLKFAKKHRRMERFCGSVNE